jgi:WD40 repeat protein
VRMTRQLATFCALVAALLPFAAQAEHTHFWRQADFADFQRGTATGVAVRSDGKITPAPRFDSFADPGMSYLWALRLDAQGRLYAAGGSDAKVLRFDVAGKPTPVFESSELGAQAIVFDAKGNLYVGTSPDGKVYKVTPDGTKSVLFDPKAKYIWSLAVDPQGDVFVGTGDKGQIFVVTPDGKGQSFYQSDQRHARSLAFDSKGNLLVGTEPDGLILRIPVTKRAARKSLRSSSIRPATFTPLPSAKNLPRPTRQLFLPRRKQSSPSRLHLAPVPQDRVPPGHRLHPQALDNREFPPPSSAHRPLARKL